MKIRFALLRSLFAGILVSVSCGPSAEELRQQQLLRDRFVDVILHSPEKWNEIRKRIARPSLSGLHLKDVVLTGLDLSGADLTGARIENVHFIDCNLSYLKTEGTVFSDVRIENSEVRILEISHGSVIEESVIMDSNVQNLSVVGAKGRIENVTFVNSDLSWMKFDSAVIRNVTIERSVVKNGDVILLQEVKKLVIKDSDITGMTYYPYQPEEDIHIVNSHPCDGPWKRFCE